jgi:hypothetical protein
MRQDTIIISLLVLSAAITFLLHEEKTVLPKLPASSNQVSKRVDKPDKQKCSCENGQHTQKCLQQKLVDEVIYKLNEYQPVVAQKMVPKNHALITNDWMKKFVDDLHLLLPTGDDKEDKVLLFIETYDGCKGL